ncbi:signal peptidase I [Ectobacillus polymachus]|uniref:signal peptidase I n=1 Tax=Ectobacillus polymachus TaxID=1508806 RepID=UPI003A8ACADE
MKRGYLFWVKTIGVSIILAASIRTFFFSTYVVQGKSMMPTLQDGNLIVINKALHQVGELHRFDVIVFHANPQEDYVKRIIGLPGDRIEYKQDKLYINGVYVDEPFLQSYKNQLSEGFLTEDFTLTQVTGKKVVPQGCVFVLGDNRLDSWDSRKFGFVDIHQIVGKVDLRYWPINEVQVRF